MEFHLDLDLAVTQCIGVDAVGIKHEMQPMGDLKLGIGGEFGLGGGAETMGVMHRLCIRSQHHWTVVEAPLALGVIAIKQEPNPALELRIVIPGDASRACFCLRRVIDEPLCCAHPAAVDDWTPCGSARWDVISLTPDRQASRSTSTT